jgi:G:T-mismatch repair DNA endonuclease (very short patch repair protein)
LFIRGDNLPHLLCPLRLLAANLHLPQNRAFWKAKLDANRRRDKLVRRTLQSRGWRILRVWEHELARVNNMRLIRRFASVSDN